MPDFDSKALRAAVLHRVGNSAAEEGYVLSGRPLRLDERLQDLLVRLFVSPFKGEEYYRFNADEGVETNDLYRCCADIFADPERLVEESRRIARRLYEATAHPDLRGGDLMVAYFDGCLFEGERVEAVGIFKCEGRDPFLQVVGDEEASGGGGAAVTAAETGAIEGQYALRMAEGIAADRLDKGAIVFRAEEEKGFVVAVAEASKSSREAQYWRDAFLEIRPREDEYFNTHTEMQAYKKFVTDELPQQFDGVSRADQADMLNRCSNYFKQNDNFDLQTFAEEVIAQPEVIDSFQQYRKQFQEDYDVQLPDSYDISESAVKKQSRAYKGVIKLDRNFHIYVHGDRDLIEQGEDEKGKYYKVYYKEES